MMPFPLVFLPWIHTLTSLSSFLTLKGVLANTHLYVCMYAHVVFILTHCICERVCVCVCVCVCHVRMSGDSGVCAKVTEVYDTMSCLPIVSDRAATEGSKCF